MISVKPIGDVINVIIAMYMYLFIVINVWIRTYSAIKKDVIRTNSDLQFKEDYFKKHTEQNGTTELLVYQTILDMYITGVKNINFAAIFGISTVVIMYGAYFYLQKEVYILGIDITALVSIFICISMLISVYMNRLHEKTQIKILNYAKHSKEN